MCHFLMPGKSLREPRTENGATQKKCGPGMTKKEEEKENDLLERGEDDWMTDEDEFLA